MTFQNKIQSINTKEGVKMEIHKSEVNSPLWKKSDKGSEGKQQVTAGKISYTYIW